MILPSDETPRQPDDPDDLPPWHNEPEPPGFFGEEEDDEAKVHNPAPEGWREELSADLADALHELKEIEDPAEEFDPPEPPDLFTFYSDLVAIRQDLHGMNAAAAAWLKTMVTGKPGELPDDSKPSARGRKGPGDSTQLLEAVIQLHDEVASSHLPLPAKLLALLKLLGLERIPASPGQLFDPETMRTKDKAKPGSRVTAELQSGWSWNRTLLRPALVSLK
jgi:hypothetical protein